MDFTGEFKRNQDFLDLSNAVPVPKIELLKDKIKKEILLFKSILYS